MPSSSPTIFPEEIESIFPFLQSKSPYPVLSNSDEPSVLSRIEEKPSPASVDPKFVANDSNEPSFITGTSFPTAIALSPIYIKGFSKAPSVRTISQEGEIEYLYPMFNSDQPSFTKEGLEEPNESSTSTETSISPLLNTPISETPTLAMGAMEESAISLINDSPVSLTNFPKEPSFIIGNIEEPMESWLPSTNSTSSLFAETFSQEPTLSPTTVYVSPLFATNNSNQQNFPSRITEATQLDKRKFIFPHKYF